MGKLVVSEFISLDGVIEDPGGAENYPYGGWSFRFPAPDSEQYKFEELLATTMRTVAKGRATLRGGRNGVPAGAAPYDYRR